MTNITRKTIMTAALAVATIVGTAGTATIIAADDAFAAERPRAGRGAPQARVPNPQFQRCAQTVIRFRDQCIANSNEDPRRIRSCKDDYQRGIAGCRRSYL